MGRKRIKHDVEQALLLAQSQRHFDFRDEDGLYPFSNVFRWRPQNGKGKGQLVSLTLDDEMASYRELTTKANNTCRFFYSSFQEQYPWAVKALARGLKTLCLDRLISHSEASYLRGAIGMFLQHCRDSKVRIDTFEDLNFQLMCHWRNGLRSVKMDSRYKSQQFRRVCKILELLMGTSEFPAKFATPVYKSDAPEQLPPFSDAVMYQLIAACITDIDQIMNAAEKFKKFSISRDVVSESDLTNCNAQDTWRQLVDSYLRGACNIRRDPGQGSLYDVKARLDLVGKLHNLSNRYPDAMNGFLDEICLVAYIEDPDKFDIIKRLDEKQISSRDSLYPFFLFFMMSSGANKETVSSWQRTYEVDGKFISPLDWKDPFDQTKCRIRGYKTRGKGRGLVEPEDTWISIAEEGMYPILKFLLWYTEPLAPLADVEFPNSLWLYASKGVVFDYRIQDIFPAATNAFLSRHEIWDMQFDSNGLLNKERLTSIDSRRFRKVFASNELIKAINEAQNFQELANQLTSAMHHKKFDTTLASYLSLGKPKDIIDIGIFSLQTKLVDEARKFRGLRIEKEKAFGRPGIYTACLDPTRPDYEGAPDVHDVECGEYDMCLGCSQSRVFTIHLPRIAKRILQYEAFRESMPRDVWDAVFGRKSARAYDLLTGWSDQEEVDKAWLQARAGSVFLPDIIVRG